MPVSIGSKSAPVEAAAPAAKAHTPGIHAQVQQMVRSGYHPDHILIGSDGAVMLDLDKVEADSFAKAVQESESGENGPAKK